MHLYGLMLIHGSMYAYESRATENTRNCILLRLGFNSSWFV